MSHTQVILCTILCKTTMWQTDFFYCGLEPDYMRSWDSSANDWVNGNGLEVWKKTPLGANQSVLIPFDGTNTAEQVKIRRLVPRILCSDFIGNLNIKFQQHVLLTVSVNWLCIWYMFNHQNQDVGKSVWMLHHHIVIVHSTGSIMLFYLCICLVIATGVISTDKGTGNNLFMFYDIGYQ